MKNNFTKYFLNNKCLCIFIFKMYQSGRIEVPSKPVLAHGPHV